MEEEGAGTTSLELAIALFGDGLFGDDFGVGFTETPGGKGMPH